MTHFPAVDVPHEHLVFDQRLPGLTCSERLLRKLLGDIGEPHPLQAESHQVNVVSQFSVHLLEPEERFVELLHLAMCGALLLS